MGVSNYIKMCERAVDIQAKRPQFGEYNVGLKWIELGSWFFDKKSGDLICFDSTGATYKWWKEHRSLQAMVWLPRQDQLQEMILNSWSKDERESSNIAVVLLDDFQDWVLNDCTGLDWSYNSQVSMEQLWLAFVMRECYNKVWLNGGWVKESK